MSHHDMTCIKCYVTRKGPNVVVVDTGGALAILLVHHHSAVASLQMSDGTWSMYKIHDRLGLHHGEHTSPAHRSIPLRVPPPPPPPC